eukprot:jgi/Bigna1/141609/aug1.63_g16317
MTTVTKVCGEGLGSGLEWGSESRFLARSLEQGQGQGSILDQDHTDGQSDGRNEKVFLLDQDRNEICNKGQNVARGKMKMKIDQGFLLGHDQSDDQSDEQSDDRNEGQRQENWSQKPTRVFFRAKVRTKVMKSGEGFGSGWDEGQRHGFW